jgi:hypothetical protein
MSRPPSLALGLLSWSADGRWLATHERASSIRLLERVDADELREALAFDVAHPFEALALSDDATWLAAAGAGQLVLWRTEERHGGRRIGEVSRGPLPPSPEGTRAELAFAPGAASLAVAVGTQVLLLRLDPEALKLPMEISTLSIRAAGESWDFVLTTPAGALRNRHRPPPLDDPIKPLDELRRTLAASPLEDSPPIESALQPLRELFVPFGLGTSQAMGATDNVLALELDEPLAAYPWELLLTGSEMAPLGLTLGLVRHTPAAVKAVLAPAPADEPIHALLLKPKLTGGLDSVADLHFQQLDRLAATLREAGPAQGRIDVLQAPDPRAAFSRLHEQRWRLLVLVGDADPEGRLRLDDGLALSAEDVQQLRHLPDMVLLLGDDFRSMAVRLRGIGVQVVVAGGWPMETESLSAFFSEFFRVLRSGDPLIRAAQMARRYAYSRSRGTAWALEVHGHSLWHWPVVGDWQGDTAPSPRELEHTYEDTASLFFNPPGDVKRLGRRLREGEFGALVSQLTPDEFLIGLYENRNQILVATHVSSKARLRELSGAELTPLGFYAMQREAANRGWDRGTPVLAKEATRPMVVVSYVRSYHALARSLVIALEATGRLNVRYDGHLSSEESFPSTVLQWVEQSDALVVLVGPASAQANYSKLELEQAQKLGKPVVAVVVEAGGLPSALASYQAVNVDDDGTLLLLAQLNGRRLESALRRVAQQVVKAIIQNPDSGPPPIRAWVLVAGTGSSRLGNKVRRAAEVLGAALARSGYGLVTGGWPGVDEAVARRFADEQKRAHPHLNLDTRLTHVVGRGKKPDYAGAVVVVDSKDAEYDESIRRVNYVVLIGGEGGTWEVALRAERAGRSVLPLADTGGDASRFHMRLKKAWETSGKLPGESVAPKFESADLIELAKPVPEAVASLIGILNRLTLSERTSPANGDEDHAAELPEKKPIKRKAKPAS